MSFALDTHAAAKEFQRAGFTEAQVEALVDNARRTASLPDIAALATKADLATMATKADFAELRAEIERAKLQAITLLLTGMALIVALDTIVSRLLR